MSQIISTLTIKLQIVVTWKIHLNYVYVIYHKSFLRVLSLQLFAA